RHDQIHANVVGLRVDGRQAADVEADAYRKRLRLHRRQGPVVITAAVPEAMALLIESDQRDEEHLRPDDYTIRRYGNTPHALPSELRGGVPAPEFKRRVLLHDHRQRGLEAALEQSMHERPQIRFPRQRPVEGDARTPRFEAAFLE